MKRCKRQLSICIVLAMLIGLLVYPSAVSAQTPLAFEDFEGESNKLGADCTNEEFEGHKAGRVAKGKSAILDFEDFSGRGVKISFDAYLKLQSGSNVNGTVVATSSDGTEDFNLVQVFQRRIRMTTGDDWPDMYTAEENGWHHIELVANLDGGTVATSVYNMNGELLAEQKYSVGP